MKQPIAENLNFDVSSGLKSVLGSELITNDEVAIFELVKNSFDASATRVDLFFGDDKIVVTDNGVGMSYDDIRQKWLFVAYSSKRLANRPEDFRDEIAERKQYAGSKGIGRFSSDRLGQIIRLQTRPSSDIKGPVHSITVDWDGFDLNHLTHFEEIDVAYAPQADGFDLPLSLPKLKHGTAITIEKTRRVWDREQILTLKSALSKLINPFGASADGFRIYIHAPAEKKGDDKRQAEAKSDGEDLPSNALVNGAVGNFIFSTLQEKTTFINVQISLDGKFIESSLTDRGEIIYRIREANEYPLLSRSGLRCQLFFLNTSAKMTFARRMGVQSVRFGSVFLFRNGFRVFPIGEDGDDWFGIDARKQQGFRRYLGSRDVIGRIDVSGSDTDFQEASSRNTGLIETPAVLQLNDFFLEHCLKRLERYVVPVTFVDVEDRQSSDLSRLLTDPGRARVASAVAKLADNDSIELLEYSKRLIGILNEQSAEFEGSLISLRAIAEKTDDAKLFKSIDEATKRFEELRHAEEAARKQADEERKAKEEAQSRAAKAEKAAAQFATCRLHRAALVVAKVDRLTRSVGFLARLLEGGVDVRFADLPTIEGPTGRFMLQQMAAVAELEAGLISTRTKAALSAAKARGQRLGGNRGARLSSEARAKGREVQALLAQRRATDLAPVREELRAGGTCSATEVARALTARGIPTARGEITWSASQVVRIKARLLIPQ